MSDSDVPRDPGAYRPSLHFPERFHDRYEDDRPPRHLDDEIVRTCIEDGEVTQPAADTLLYRHEFGGVDYRLVVNPQKEEVVTGYPVEIDTDVAEASGRWSPDQIDDIQEFIRTDPRDAVNGAEYCH
jgi:hypothetical protein